MRFHEIVLATGDATLLSQEFKTSDLILKLKMWDDSTREFIAHDADILEDRGTYEVDAIVRLRDLDSPTGKRAYGLVDTEGRVTLTFRAKVLDSKA